MMKMQTIEKGNRINWIDGLRGISCLLIFTHHFLLAVFPATYYGTAATLHSEKWELFYAQSPLGFLTNGNLWVCMFCIISGMVVSFPAMKEQYEKVSDSMLKRYFRLALPVFFVCLIVYLMGKLNLFVNAEAAGITGSPWLGKYYQTMPGFLQIFVSAFISIWFIGDNTFATAFWMLSTLFYGLCTQHPVMEEGKKDPVGLCGAFAYLFVHEFHDAMFFHRRDPCVLPFSQT
jgi:peptidoglycan/LPS O-acetylase OafA/YrhL